MVQDLSNIEELPRHLPRESVQALQAAWQEHCQHLDMQRLQRELIEHGGMPGNSLLQMATGKLRDELFEVMHAKIYALSQDDSIPNVQEKAMIADRNLIQFLHQSASDLQLPYYGLGDHEVASHTWGKAKAEDYPPLNEAQAQAIVSTAYEAARHVYDQTVTRMNSRPMVAMPKPDAKLHPFDLRMLGVVAQEVVELGQKLEAPDISRTDDVIQCISAGAQMEVIRKTNFHQLSTDHPRSDATRKEAAASVVAVLDHMRPALADLASKQPFTGDPLEAPIVAARDLKRTVDTAIAAEAELGENRSDGLKAHRTQNPWQGIGPRSKKTSATSGPPAHHPGTNSFLR